MSGPPNPSSNPLIFQLGGLSINVTSDNVVIESYTNPVLKNGIYIKATLSVDEAKKTFVYITDDINKTLRETLTSVTYCVLKKNIATSGTPIYSHEKTIPYDTFTMGFTPLPNATGFSMTKYTSPTATDITVPTNLINYIAKQIQFSAADIATAEAAVDLKLPNGSYLYSDPAGITNRGLFVQNFNNNLKNGFSNKLNSLSLNSDGLGTSWLSNPPTNPDGSTDFYNPAMEVAKKMFFSDEGRLSTTGTPIADSQALGVKAGFTAVGLPFQSGDKIHLNITVTITQTGFGGSTIPNRVYLAEITLV